MTKPHNPNGQNPPDGQPAKPSASPQPARPGAPRLAAGAGGASSVSPARPVQAPAARPAQAPPARPAQAPAARSAQAPVARSEAGSPGQTTPAVRLAAAPIAPAPGPDATPKEVIDHLSGQIQLLATRLEALRQQGAGNTTEFRQLEQMLNMVQDKLIMAQQRIGRR